MKPNLTEERKLKIEPLVEALKYFRLEKDVSERKLAEMVGIHKDSLNRFMNLKADTGIGIILDILEVLGIDLLDLALLTSSCDREAAVERVDKIYNHRESIKDTDFDMPSRLRASKRIEQNENK